MTKPIKKTPLTNLKNASKPGPKTGPKTGLGRGFDSLLPQNFDETLLLSSADKIEKIPIDRLSPNKYQPRQEFDATGLEDMAASIRQYGVLQPLIVAFHDDNDNDGNSSGSQTAGYMIIAGERRWRASKLAGLTHVPAIVRSLKDLERLEVALIENVQRVDLSPLEQAESIEYLHQNFGTSYTDIAKRLGKGNSTVVNIVRLMQLPAEAKDALRTGKITEGHARAVLALREHPADQMTLLGHVIKHGWTVRQAEQFVVSVRDGHHEPKVARERLSTETPATKRLSERLAAPVRIRRMAKGGKLEVAFTSDEQLETILKALAT
jgi:ParB family transcriptional regulator, chromosome partitioning protein